jgi:hypothetical protein
MISGGGIKEIAALASLDGNTTNDLMFISIGLILQEVVFE